MSPYCAATTTERNPEPAVPAPLLLDLSHTSHTRARTGIQRVTRALRRALAGRCTAVCFDPYEGAWRKLDPFEERNIAAPGPSNGRGARWPLSARLRGTLRRLLRGRRRLAAQLPAGQAAGAALVPEVFSPAVAAALPELFSATSGPRVALFHDALALQFPELTPRSNTARFPAYLRELLLFDGVAAVSEASRESLLAYWRWLGVGAVPEVACVTLGIDAPLASAAQPATAPLPIVLCVGSIEGRKNHAALLDACETLWSKGAAFELRLVGITNAETGAAALRKLESLRAAGRPVRHDGPLDDAALEAAYHACAFTVYPSLAEGFGLPVAESLARGKPCACRMEGALGEVARGGGCVDLGGASAPEIAAALGGLLSSPGQLAALASAAKGRQFKPWASYASELSDWIATLRRHA